MNTYSKLDLWYLLKKSYYYLPLTEGYGTTVINKVYDYYNTLLWGNILSNQQNIPSNTVWVSDPTLPFLCEGNEWLVSGHCIKTNKNLWFIKSSTYKIVLPLQEYNSEFSWDMWIYWGSPAGAHTETIISRPSSTKLELYSDGTNTKFNFYAAGIGTTNSMGLTYLSTTTQTKAAITGCWILITCGNSISFGKSILSARSTNTIFGVTVSTAFTLQSGKDLVLELGSDDPTYAYEGAIREVRIWNYYRGSTPSADSMYNELEPRTELGLLHYWKLSESIGNTINDYTTQSLSSSLIRSVSGKTSPAWVTGASTLVLGSPEKTKGVICKNKF